MVRRRSEYPEEGDFVVGSVKEVKDYGAFVTLEEYPEKEGFIHISEVASGWVKYVRDHVRENQKVVCKVTDVDKSKGHVDLSLKRVNEHQKRDKLQEWKNEQKADKLLELVAEKLDRDVEDLYDEFVYDLADEFGGVYGAFEAVVMDEEILDEVGLDGDWSDAFLEIAEENITIPYVDITGYLEVTCPVSDGVDVIRDALSEAEETDDEDVDVQVQYLGAPNYRITVKAPDYKIAEEELREASDRAIAVVEGGGGAGRFERERED